jgi:Protein of unknown function (DUF1551).
MNKFKRFSWFGVIFLAVFLCVSLPQAQSADAPAAATTVASAPDDNCPKVTVKLGAMFLRRGDNHDNRLVQYSDYTNASVDSDDLDLGWAPGMDASIMIQNPSFGIEARYLGLTEWDESKTDIQYNQRIGDARAKFKSKLSNVELNLHWWPCENDRYSFFAGFRWLRLTDRVVSNWDDFYGKYDPSSRNKLYGGQIGIEGLLFGKRDKGFSLDGSVKTGFYANNIQNKESGYTWSDSRTTSKGVNLSELGLNLNYAFTKNIAMTVGYELLYISRISTPVAENYDTGSQSVLYQGSRVGLNFMF